MEPCQSKQDDIIIIDFSTLGSGDGRDVDMCSDCRYHIKISYRDKPATVAWLTGAQITGQYGSHDVKITIRGMKRCKRHSSSRSVVPDNKLKHNFMEAALASGIDINESVDEYRKNILQQRASNVRL